METGSWIHCLNNSRGCYAFFFVVFKKFALSCWTYILVPSCLDHQFQNQVLHFHPCETPSCCIKTVAFQIHRETDSELEIMKVGNKKTIKKKNNKWHKPLYFPDQNNTIPMLVTTLQKNIYTTLFSLNIHHATSHNDVPGLSALLLATTWQQRTKF